MTAQYKAPRGTRDTLPEDQPYWEFVREAASRTSTAFGYESIETPVFEEASLFTRGVGEVTDIVQKEMYIFKDRGGLDLALRPEGTAPVCRAYLEHGMHNLPQPVRLWYWTPIFRYDRPQAGRYRQFWQIGAESIGSDTPETDAELIVLLADLLDAVGARDTTLRLSSLGTPETRAVYRDEVKDYLRANESRLSD